MTPYMYVYVCMRERRVVCMYEERERGDGTLFLCTLVLKDIFEWLHGRIEHVTTSTAVAHGCTADVNFAPAMDGVTREVGLLGWVGGGGRELNEIEMK